jgi:hypothetical protein
MFLGNITLEEALALPLQTRKKVDYGHYPMQQGKVAKLILDTLQEDGYNPHVVAVAVNGKYKIAMAIRVDIPGHDVRAFGRPCMGLFLCENAQNRPRVLSGLTFDDDLGHVVGPAVFSKRDITGSTPEEAAQTMIDRYLDHAVFVGRHLQRLRHDNVGTRRLHGLVIGMIRPIHSFPSQNARELLMMLEKLKPRTALAVMRSFAAYCRGFPSIKQLYYQGLMADLIYSHTRHRK